MLYNRATASTCLCGSFCTFHMFLHFTFRDISDTMVMSSHEYAVMRQGWNASLRACVIVIYNLVAHGSPLPLQSTERDPVTLSRN